MASMSLATMLAVAAATSPVSIQIEEKAPGKPISDLIYGRNDLSFGRHDTDLTYPIVRFGGNATSRYNWQQNAWNAGKDWYFLNIVFPYQAKVGTHSGNFSYTDAIILKQSSLGQDTLITIPMIGWVAKNREKSWAYSVKKYGKQQATEQDQSRGDAGNGKLPNGSPLKKGSPMDTSVAAPPEFMAEWVEHNRALSRKHTPKGPGVRFYALDNEPMLWHDTHQDLRYGDPKLKTPEVGYDELWERTVAYGTAVRKADPQAKILGPSEWGWCSYMSSARDQCKSGPDRAAHGGKPLLAWYLKKVCEHQKKTGVRLVDYLDIHYYPMTEKSLEDESSEGQKLRFEATRSLHEKGFKDGSWIEDAIELIPRMKQWIKEECPDTKLAITEYRFGAAAEGLSSTLANAEALAIFGRDGVDLATFWGHIPKGSKLEGAFALYLNYDGKGASARDGYSLPTQSSRATDIPAYTIRTKDKLLVYVFNKTKQEANLDWKGLKDWTMERSFVINARGKLGLTKATTKAEPYAVTLFEWRKK
jgi:hypothetical protein